ncbi:MAG: hypothetical protein QOG64_2434 [Acidimicrobiaceae bacterium]|jgi:hypothetical protein|nr:hypothetical protein [Acidimicrobiaceae bacterium]
MPSPCPDCGFDDHAVSPADAAVALRSFPRRYRSLFAVPAEDMGEDPVRRAGTTGWSALAHATWAGLSFDAVAEALHQVLVHDHPDISVPSLDPPAPPVDQPTAAVLDRLARAAEMLAVAIDGAGGGQWKRTGRTTSGERSALDLVRVAVHQGVHHLRLAERVLKEVTGRPG